MGSFHKSHRFKVILDKLFVAKYIFELELFIGMDQNFVYFIGMDKIYLFQSYVLLPLWWWQLLSLQICGQILMRLCVTLLFAKTWTLWPMLLPSIFWITPFYMRMFDFFVVSCFWYCRLFFPLKKSPNVSFFLQVSFLGLRFTVEFRENLSMSTTTIHLFTSNVSMEWSGKNNLPWVAS